MSDAQQQTLTFLRAELQRTQSGELQEITTHISHVLMCGNLAWKLKRAVQFPYLDFSTPELRLHAAQTELELNRRTAPQLYLRTRTIMRESDGSLKLDGEGALVDTIVEMRRFDQALLFDALAKANQLNASVMSELAAEIAQFHESTRPNLTVDGAESIRSVLTMNDTALCASGLLSEAECEAHAVAFRGAFETLAPLLHQRGRQGKIRHCHGDLNLRNICLYEGRPTLFDCIEFDEKLATIDVLYDLAFLLMDLWHRDQTALANLTFNRYFDLCDETDGLPLLPFFMAIRAAIRAHVTAMQAKDAEGARAKELLAEALSYHQLAKILLQPQPQLCIAIGGLSGSGKSTLAAKIAAHIGPAPGARSLNSDRERKKLRGVNPLEKLPPEAYALNVSREVYAHLYAEAERVLQTGHSLIVDAVFARADERAAIERVAQSNGVAFYGTWLDAPLTERATRVDARRGDPSDANSSVVELQARYDLGEMLWHRINTASPGAAQRALALIKSISP